MNFTPNFAGIINALKHIIENGIAGSSGGGGSGSDASAANQITQTNELIAIKNRLPANGALSEGNDIDSTSIPTGGSGARGWLSAIWKLINDKIPNTISNLIPVLAENPAPLEIVGSASANNTDIFSGDVSQYRFASIQVGGTFVATVSFQVSNDGNNWVANTMYNVSASTSFSGGATSPAIFAGVVSGKFFRVRITAYTSGIVSLNLLLYKNPPNNTSSAGLVATTGTTTVSGNVTSVGTVIHDAVLSGSVAPTIIGASARTANYTPVGNSDAAQLVCSTVGALVVSPYSIPDLYINGTLPAMTGTSDVAVLGAGGAGIRNYVTGGIIANNSATATLVEIKDGTIVMARVFSPANQTIDFNLQVPLRSTANTGVNVANTTTGSSTFVTLTGYRAP